jgi:hypothetical protein
MFTSGWMVSADLELLELELFAFADLAFFLVLLTIINHQLGENCGWYLKLIANKQLPTLSQLNSG